MAALEIALKKVDVPLLQTVSQLLTAQGIRHALIGSAGLQLLNKLPPGFVAQDVDFLVDRAPYVKEPLPKEACSKSDSVAVEMDGIKVDFIVTNFWSNNKRMRRFFTKRPAIVQGVPVADLEDILGLKASAGRKKDFEFLFAWMRKYGEPPKKHRISFLQRVLELF